MSSLEVGKGSFGVVRVDPQDARVVRKTSTALYQFAREVAALAFLPHHHPRLVGFEGFEVTADVLTLRLRRCPCTLHDWIHTHPPLSARVRRAWRHDLLAALRVVQSHGLMHRDIKPSNVLVDATRQRAQLRLADFGTCVTVEAGRAYTVACGTWDYAAPEMFRADGNYDARVDWWSLGLVFEEMRTGARAVCMAHLKPRNTPEMAEATRLVRCWTPPPTPGAEGDLIRQLTAVDPDARRLHIRPVAASCRSPPWSAASQRPAAWQRSAAWQRYPASARPTLVEWLEQVARAFRFGEPARLVVHTSGLLDTLVALRRVAVDDLQLYAMACMHFATLFHEHTFAHTKDWVFIAAEKYTAEQVERAVRDVTSCLAGHAHRLDPRRWKSGTGGEALPHSESESSSESATRLEEEEDDVLDRLAMAL